jgi:hypothetical protein
MPLAQLANSAAKMPGTDSARLSFGSEHPMKKPAVLISHPTGNQNLRNALRSLIENSLLGEFWTTVAWDRDSPWNRLLPSGLRNQLARRSYPDTPNRSSGSKTAAA